MYYFFLKNAYRSYKISLIALTQNSRWSSTRTKISAVERFRKNKDTFHLFHLQLGKYLILGIQIFPSHPHLDDLEQMMSSLLVLATYLHRSAHHKNHTTEFKASSAEWSCIPKQAQETSKHQHITKQSLTPYIPNQGFQRNSLGECDSQDGRRKM